MPTFGSRKNNQKTSGAGGDFEMFIKNFKDPQTRIAVLDPDPNEWVKYLEHFDNSMKMAFPCAKFEEAPECIGCDYPVEHPEYADLDDHFPEGSYSEKARAREKADKGWGVRNTSSKWVFPAIDPKGYVSLFKVGVGLRDDFIAQHKILGSIQNNEWVVTREGTGFGTEYKLVNVPGEVRKPKGGAPIPGEAEISSLLGKKYTYALEKYGFDTGLDEGAATVADDPAPQEPDPANLSAPAAAQPAQAPNTGPAVEPGDSPAHGFIPREASTGEIKDWLASLTPPVEFPAKAARQVLVKLAEDTMTERQIANF